MWENRVALILKYMLSITTNKTKFSLAIAKIYLKRIRNICGIGGFPKQRTF